MKKPHILAAGALAFLLPHATFAQEAVAAPAPEGGVNPAQEALPPAAVETKNKDSWLSYGGDFRARYESFDHVPVTGPISDYWSFFRFRSRLFAKIDLGDFTFHTRAVNEWRKFHNRHGRNSYPFSDELVFDLLYAEFRNDCLGFPMRLRVGRQEIMDLGSLRVLGEGTAGDGSRTFTFNAARLTLTPVEKVDIDFLGIYNRWYDALAIGGLDGDIVRDRKRDLNGNRSDEGGAGVYLTDKRDADLNYEAYYLWKHETKDARGRVAGGDGRDTHTLGTRLLPKLTDSLSGELEVAGQLGRTEDHRAIHAYMLHAGLTQTFDPFNKLTPYVSAAAAVFSGDKDESTGHISGWNPMWGRLPQYGDLSGMQYPGMSFWYQNLVYPHLELGFKNDERNPNLRHYLRFQTGPMFAQRVNGSDVSAAAAGDSRYRGWHFFSQYGVPLVKEAGPLKALTAMVEADCILPGNYFDQASPVYFLRFQLQAAF